MEFRPFERRCDCSLLDGGKICLVAGARVGPQSLHKQETTRWGIVRLRLVDGHAEVVRVPLTDRMRPRMHSVCVGSDTMK